MSIWYYAGTERQPLGPYSAEEIKQFFQSHTIALNTLVWCEGAPQWLPLTEYAQQLGLLEKVTSTSFEVELKLVPDDALDTFQIAPSVPSLTPTAPPDPTPPAAPLLSPTPQPAQEPAPAPTHGRAVFSLGSDPAPQSAYARPEKTPARTDAAHNPYQASHVPLTSHAAHTIPGEHVVYAGFWKRAAASIIDSTILLITVKLCVELISALLGDLLGNQVLIDRLVDPILTLLLQSCYYAWFYSNFSYATPGKMAVGIKVMRGNGDPISFLRGVARYFASMISAMVLFIGYLMAAFTGRKQALHDFICDTIVVDKWAYTENPEYQDSELGRVAIIALSLYGLLIVAGVIMLLFFGLGSSMQLTK